ncbi:MAG TPA: F0F1 ATP synthase subunit delta [Burkholderiaceae bacterium]|nr:F0F1 ATP synthase subunit delta [Burkholderiaceae bacterium]
MAENLTIARPYAEAVFASADAGGNLQEWSQALQRLALIVADPDMHSAIGDPKVDPEQLYGLVAAGASGALHAQAQNFVRALIENDRLSLLPEIATLFESLKDEREGVIEAQIVSAFPVDDAALTQLVSDLERRFKRKVRPQVSVDRELIGGALITVGDEVIDGTVRGRLESMASALRTA